MPLLLQQISDLTQRHVTRQLATWFGKMIDPNAVEAFLRSRVDRSGLEVAEELRALQERLASIDRTLAGLADRLGLVPDAALPAVRQRMEQLATEREAIAARRGDLRLLAARTPDQMQLREQVLSIAAQAHELLTQAPSHVVQAKLHRLFPMPYT